MDMVTYAALQKQIRDAAGGGNADRDVFYFDIPAATDTIACTFDELKTACQSNKILQFSYRNSAKYLGFASSVSDSKIEISSISYEIKQYAQFATFSVAADGKVSCDIRDQLATVQTVRDTVQEELSYAGGGIIHLVCMMSNDFGVMQDDGITISDLFDAADVWSPVKACLHCYANPVLDQAFMGQIFANDMRYDQFARICTFPVLYKGRSFELTVHEDETIEFAEVASATA